jgi:choline/glycine/proline betaine transport protein
MWSAKNKNKNNLNYGVFASASLIIAALVLLTVWDAEGVTERFQGMQSVIVDTAGWFYVLAVAFVLVAVVYLCFSRFGNIKLGLDHQQPQYPFTTWLAMLFSAGMGIGLMFYGVAEPVMHFMAPPTATPESIAATKEALKMTFFHWGLHAWAIYAIVALILAYFAFRQNLPLTLRSALHPIWGDKIFTWRGDLIDAFAIVSTVFGVATSLGIGVLQINAGADLLFGIGISNTAQIIIMALVVMFASISVATGLDRGIKILSQINMCLAVLFLLFILLNGPSLFLMQALVQNIGSYLSDIVHNTFNLYAYQQTDWIGGWTIYYWAWWLAWSPFVGMFIARISRGRTIREFVIGVLIVPTLFTFSWMTFFGNSAIDLIANEDLASLGVAVKDNTALALFAFLDNYPATNFVSGIALIMVVIFFVTSCDSGAMVVDMLASNGENNTPIWQRLYWTSSIGVVSGILLFSGGLGALQALTIAAALPFTVVLLMALYGTFKALQIDATKQQAMGTLAPSIAAEDGDWRARLAQIVNFPNKAKVNTFLQEVVKAALTDVQREMIAQSLDAELVSSAERLSLRITHAGQPDFLYSVQTRVASQPDLLSAEDDVVEADNEQEYYRAEVHLTEGGQDYCVMQWSKEAIINDVIEQYQKHIHFLQQLN